MKTCSLIVLLAAGAFASATPLVVVRRVSCAPVVTTHHGAPGTLLGHDAAYTYYPDHGYARVGYSAPDKDEVVKAKDETIRAKDELIAYLKASLAGGGSIPPSLKAALAPPSPGLGVLVANCASCHDALVAKSKGGDLPWLKDGRFVDEGENLSLVMAALKTGKMGARDLPKIDDGKKLAAVFFLTTELGDKADTPAAPKRTAMPPAAVETP